jgi:adenosylcobinamide-phosphate synthase
MFTESLLAGAVILVSALLLDRWLGEPKRWHPLVGFGHWAARIEARCRTLKGLSLRQQGGLAWGLAVAGPVLVCAGLEVALANVSVWAWGAFNALALYLTLGGRSLIEHAERIYEPLKAGDSEQARQAVAMIVSRNTDKMNEADMTSAAMESVLENGNDAVFAPLFWFVLLGAPGAVLFRLANTLDAMWGYKNDRYIDFGRFSAKTDDVLAYLPARMTALVYGALGDFKGAMSCWRNQAQQCASPNGGVVMTAGAGALGVIIGGPTYYHGVLHDKKPMGAGVVACWRDIARANRLVARGSAGLGVVWLLVCLSLYFLMY